MIIYFLELATFAGCAINQYKSHVNSMTENACMKLSPYSKPFLANIGATKHTATTLPGWSVLMRCLATTNTRLGVGRRVSANFAKVGQSKHSSIYT